VDEPGVGEMKSDGPITNLRRPRTTSPMSKITPTTKQTRLVMKRVQRGRTRRKVEELSDIRTLDERVQRRLQEVKLQLCSGSILSAAKFSDSSLFEEILKCEFAKKFSTPTFDYYSGTRNSVQHIRHF